MEASRGQRSSIVHRTPGKLDDRAYLRGEVVTGIHEGCIVERIRHADLDGRFGRIGRGAVVHRHANRKGAWTGIGMRRFRVSCGGRTVSEIPEEGQGISVGIETLRRRERDLEPDEAGRIALEVGDGR